jgi:hypothetical protein
MVHRWFGKTKFIVFAPLMLFLLWAVACGTAAEPAAAPADKSPHSYSASTDGASKYPSSCRGNGCADANAPSHQRARRRDDGGPRGSAALC